MTQISTEQLLAEWQAVLAATPPSVFQATKKLAQQYAAQLATSFYKHMLEDPAAAQFLSHEQVQSRLSSSMQRWIIKLLSLTSADDLQPILAQQKHVGDVHARIDIPVHLVLRGARVLKETAHQLLNDHPLQKECSSFIATLVDMAMEVMSQAYSASIERSFRAEESYRLFSIAQNSAHEKDRQRAALFDWQNQTMFDLAMGLQGSQIGSLSSSEFGLWFRHKGAHAFEGSSEASAVETTINHIDTVLLPMFNPPTDQLKPHQELLRDLHKQIRSIAYLIDTLFTQASELEGGRDVLTRLLNRKFLPVVMNKEISFARVNNKNFSVLMIDVDYFKNINDSYGHEAGDVVLQQVANLLSSSCRSGDYVFRVGGEEFLVLLVDIAPDKASKVAENLRALIEKEAFSLPDGTDLKLTVSIGVAEYAGHPDPQQLLNRVDKALYKAKNHGRNQIVFAD